MKLFNQQHRFVQVLLLLTAGGAIVALAAWGIFLARGGAENGIEAITAIVSGVFAVTMLICALATVPASRRATRWLARMRAGEAAAHWVYPKDFWEAWVRRERRWFGSATWGAIAVVAIMGGIITYALSTAPVAAGPGRAATVATSAAITLGVIGLIVLGMLSYRGRRVRRLLACGECYLMNDAAYVGGDFAYWNAHMRGLHGVELKEATDKSPAVIELSIGMSRGAGKVTRAAGAASLAAGGAYFSEYLTITRIPVPDQHIEEARTIVAAWTSGR